MSWISLQSRAEELGFELVFRVRPDDDGGLVPDFKGPEDGAWLLVGNYEHAAGLWVRARTDAARQLPRGRLAAILAEGDRFFEPVAEYEADFFAAGEPMRAVIHNLEHLIF